MPKRSISSVLNDDEQIELQPPKTKTRTEFHQLSYPSTSNPTKPVPFQQPSPLITFSYTTERVLEFTDAARRYYVEAPLGAKLDYGYDRWIRRPEERGRLDGLLKALIRVVKEKNAPPLPAISVVAWRGVMTK